MKKEVENKFDLGSLKFIPNGSMSVKDTAEANTKILEDFILNLQQENKRNKAEAESQHKSFIDCFKTNLGLIVQCHITSNALKFACEELKSESSDINSKFYTMKTEDIFEYFISEGAKH